MITSRSEPLYRLFVYMYSISEQPLHACSLLYTSLCYHQLCRVSALYTASRKKLSNDYFCDNYVKCEAMSVAI